MSASKTATMKVFIFFFDLALLGGFANADGYSKVLLARGKVKIIDLSSSETSCQNLKHLPDEENFDAGGLGFEEKPLICTRTGACYVYKDGAWNQSFTLNEGGSQYAMVKSPFQDGGSKLFKTGGNNYPALNSSEFLTENGWQESVPLPVSIYSHCMVTVNATTIMVIGGIQNGPITSGSTFIFNSETNIWTEGPPLNIPRKLHSCGIINKNSQSQEKSIIVAGGIRFLNIGIYKVEILDLDSNEWRFGPDLSQKTYGASMVEHPSGGVVLIGGQIDEFKPIKTLSRLPHAGQDAIWEMLPQTLELESEGDGHITFLIPDGIADCS